MLRAVDVRAELTAFLFQLSDACQGKNLKTTRIRQDGLVPCVELVQATSLTQNVKSRTQIQMVGVAQDNLCLYLFA